MASDKVHFPPGARGYVGDRQETDAELRERLTGGARESVPIAINVTAPRNLRAGDQLLRRPFHDCPACGKLFDEGDIVSDVLFEGGKVTIHRGCL